MDEINITILCDSFNGAVSGFTKDEGFSCAVEIGNRKILFDTGMHHNHLSHNLHRAGLKPKDFDAIILSHNHNDHTDGLKAILEDNPGAPVFIHNKWENGIPFQGMDIPGDNKKVIHDPGKQGGVLSNIILTSALHSSDYGGITEHAMIIPLEKSFILVCGCCHPGLSAFLDEREKYGIETAMPFHIIGGMHGFTFPEKQAHELQSVVLSVTLCHCTQNVTIFKKQFAEKCKTGVLGKRYHYSSNH
jgi:7,8-dihydropterin-6-yl-methyl-4-(beta-D-ribofuranosyl)aminobenzene 5'-phosphate synthase